MIAETFAPFRGVKPFAIMGLPLGAVPNKSSSKGTGRRIFIEAVQVIAP
jgi:hypothetical protein